MIKENIEYILLIIFIFMIYFIFFKKGEREYFENKEENLHIQKMIDFENEWMEKKFPLKKNYHSIIPLNVYQTWYTTDLPPKMKECHELLKKQNPEFTFHLFDDQNCQDFIKKHFDQKVLNAYNTLIPGAYKADLWRYCVLYIQGGIYLDIKYFCVNDFKLIALTDKEYFVRDFSDRFTMGPMIGLDQGIYNGLLVSKPNNPILKEAIDKIVTYVEKQFYGTHPLDVTGPLMLRSFFKNSDIKKMKLNFYRRVEDKHCIRWNLYKILDNYKEYREEQNQFSNKKHYGDLWRSKKIYQL